MATIQERVAPQSPASPFVPSGQWLGWWVQPMVEVQRAQWDALAAWQRSLAALNKDLWEQWTVRFCGGVPLDG